MTRPDSGPSASPPSVGLLRVGDAPLCLGTDPAAVTLLDALGTGARLAFLEQVGSDPVDVADALDRASRRAFPVLVWAAGEAAAEWAVGACLAARDRGRAAVGRSPLGWQERPWGVRAGNLLWVRGTVEAWAGRLAEALADGPQPPAARREAEASRCVGRVAWCWPETAGAAAARLRLEETHPDVLQRLVRGAAGAAPAVLLELSAPSRSRLAAATRLLGQAAAESRVRVHPRNPVRGR